MIPVQEPDPRGLPPMPGMPHPQEAHFWQARRLRRARNKLAAKVQRQSLYFGGANLVVSIAIALRVFGIV